MIYHFKYTQQALIRHAHTRILKNQETPVEKNITRRKMHGKNEYLVLYTHNTGSSIWIEPILDNYCGFFIL